MKWNVYFRVQIREIGKTRLMLIAKHENYKCQTWNLGFKPKTNILHNQFNITFQTFKKFNVIPKKNSMTIKIRGS